MRRLLSPYQQYSTKGEDYYFRMQTDTNIISRDITNMFGDVLIVSHDEMFSMTQFKFIHTLAFSSMYINCSGQKLMHSFGYQPLIRGHNIYGY